jgi:hypothetical protein
MYGIYDIRKHIFYQTFRAWNLPQEFPDGWDRGPFILDQFERSVIAQSEGELLYTGTRLNDLKYLEDTASSRYNVLVGFRGQGGASQSSEFHFEIRQRRQSADTYVAVEVDSENSTVSLLEKQSGITTASTSQAYSFNECRINWLEFWVYDDKCYAFINGAPAGELTISSNNEDGFSFYAYQTSDGYFVRFYQVQARELEPQPAEQLNNNSLWVILRQQIRDQVNNPIPGDYDEFKRVWMLWEKNKDKPVPDKLWWEAGYPLREPPVEEWQL